MCMQKKQMRNLKLQKWNVKCLAFSFEGLCICYCKAYAKYPFFKWWLAASYFILELFHYIHFTSIYGRPLWLLLIAYLAPWRFVFNRFKRLMTELIFTFKFSFFFFLQSDHIYTSLIITFLVQVEAFNFLHCRHKHKCTNCNQYCST